MLKQIGKNGRNINEENFIADELITKPRELDEFYREVVPEETRGHIRRRDGG